MTANTNKKDTSCKRVQVFRERMRTQGLRPLQIWVPDTRTEATANCCP